MVMFRHVRIIVLNALRFLDSVYKHSIPPFQTILALQDIWVYICPLNHGNKASNVEAPVD